MRILHAVQRYFPVLGGTENSTRELSLELAKMGNDVSVFTTDALELDYDRCTKYITETSFEDSGVKVYRFHVVNSIIYRNLVKIFDLITKATRKLGVPENKLSMLSWALYSSPFTPSLNRTLANSKGFDIVNGTMFGWGNLLFLEKICLRNKIPFVFTPRSHIFDSGFKRTSPLWLKISQDATAVIVFTPQEKDYYVSHGIDSNKIFVTGIAVCPENFKPSDPILFKQAHNIPINHKVVLHIGRMDEYKGAGLIISSMEAVWTQEPETSLVIIGKSTAFTRQIEQIAKNENRIVVLPNASEKTKWAALSCSDLLVHPSELESFGRVFLEAWAVKKPVIGARTPVNKYLIDEGKDGLILNGLNPEEVAKKILFLLKNENVAREMGIRGNTKFLGNFTWDKIAQKTFQAYEWARKQKIR